MVSLALIVELSGARGVSRLRRCNGFCTLRLYLPADWAQKNIMAKNLSRQIQNSCERFVLHVFLGLSRQRAGPMAHAWTSTRLRFLLLGDVISSHLPASLAVGMAVGMAGAAAPPPATPGAQDAASRRKSRRSSKGNGYSNKRRMSRHPLPRVCTIIRTINH